MKRSAIYLLIAAFFCSMPASAHHGVASLGAAGPEGPGVAIETTSAITLPAASSLAMVKSEYVSFRQFDHAAPQNKSFSLFDTAALGFGITPYLSALVFQPFNFKSQEGVGLSNGLGDTNLMLTLGFKYDEGLRLAPEKESLDELRDWHFGLWVSSTLPSGSIERRDDQGEYYAPDMQTGFGAPSPAVGLAALKQVSDNFTWLAEANYQHFFEHEYSYTRYQFGAETRVGTALVYRLWGRGKVRADVDLEVTMLNLRRDRERSENGSMESLTASGGTILYASLGGRLSYGPLALAAGAKRAALKSLNEADDQQGSEGLENARLSLALSYFHQF